MGWNVLNYARPLQFTAVYIRPPYPATTLQTIYKQESDLKGRFPVYIIVGKNYAFSVRCEKLGISVFLIEL